MTDTTYFIPDHVAILSSSCLDLVKFTVTSFFSSGSSADVCTFVCFSFHVLSGCHKKDGPLNHISVAVPFVVLIPLELRSAAFSLVLT